MKLTIGGLVLLAASLCCFVVNPVRAYAGMDAFVEEYHQSVPLPANGSLKLQNLNGPVHITGWDKDEVRIDAVKKADSEQHLADTHISVSVRGRSKALVVRTEFPSAKAAAPNNSSMPVVEYTLLVPRRLTLGSVEVINGTVEVSGVEGGVTASATATGVTVSIGSASDKQIPRKALHSRHVSFMNKYCTDEESEN